MENIDINKFTYKDLKEENMDLGQVGHGINDEIQFLFDLDSEDFEEVYLHEGIDNFFKGVEIQVPLIQWGLAVVMEMYLKEKQSVMTESAFDTEYGRMTDLYRKIYTEHGFAPEI